MDGKGLVDVSTHEVIVPGLDTWELAGWKLSWLGLEAQNGVDVGLLLGRRQSAPLLTAVTLLQAAAVLGRVLVGVSGKLDKTGGSELVSSRSGGRSKSIRGRQQSGGGCQPVRKVEMHEVQRSADSHSLCMDEKEKV